MGIFGKCIVVMAVSEFADSNGAEKNSLIAYFFLCTQESRVETQKIRLDNPATGTNQSACLLLADAVSHSGAVKET
jgi:hypothetical protein